jgi:hypothetical protein
MHIYYTHTRTCIIHTHAHALYRQITHAHILYRHINDLQGRCTHLENSLKAYTSWNPPASVELASMHVAFGIALARTLRKEDAIRELNFGLEMQKLCVGCESLAVKTTEKVVRKIEGGARIEELGDDA